MWKCSPSGRMTRNANTSEQLRPVRQDVAGALRLRCQRRQRIAQPASGERKGALVGDPGIRSGEEREAEAVEQEIGDHDRGDQRQDQQRLAIGLEPRGLAHIAPPEGEGHGGQHGKFHDVLPRSEETACEPGIGERLVVADGDQLQLAREQRHEAQEDDRVHEAGLPLAADHPGLQEAVAQDAAEPLHRMVPARLGRQVRDDAQLSRGQETEGREGGQHQQRNPEGTHRLTG